MVNFRNRKIMIFVVILILISSTMLSGCNDKAEISIS